MASSSKKGSGSGDDWKTVEAPKRPTVTKTSTVSGTYSAEFVAGGIASSSPTYKRSLSVGRFTTTRKEFDDGTISFRTVHTGRKHTHYNADGTVHTAAHTPTDGSTITGPLRPGVKKTFD